MSDELLPCPFCGGTEQKVKSSGRWGWFVSCKCCAVGPSAGSRDEAIDAWNRRCYDTALNRADIENAKLRDLLAKAWGRDKELGCSVYGTCRKPICQYNGECSLTNALHELGIEEV